MDNFKDVWQLKRYHFYFLQDGKPLIWPDDAVSAVTALERASHDALSSDSQKYNQKLRQLVFNLKVRLGLFIMCLLFLEVLINSWCILSTFLFFTILSGVYLAEQCGSSPSPSKWRIGTFEDTQHVT